MARNESRAAGLADGELATADALEARGGFRSGWAFECWLATATPAPVDGDTYYTDAFMEGARGHFERWSRHPDRQAEHMADRGDYERDAAKDRG